jgi:hypothetical protein
MLAFLKLLFEDFGRNVGMPEIEKLIFATT